MRYSQHEMFPFHLGKKFNKSWTQWKSYKLYPKWMNLLHGVLGWWWSRESENVCGPKTTVLREVHPLPKVNEILAQLAGATVFSKLDANCANPTSQGIHYLYNTRGEVLPQQASLRNLKCPRGISEKEDSNLEWSARSRLPDWDVLMFGANTTEGWQQFCNTFRQQASHWTKIHYRPARYSFRPREESSNQADERAHQYHWTPMIFMGMVNQLSPNIAEYSSGSF